MEHLPSEQVYFNRTRARGALVMLLAMLVLISLAWYFLMPRTLFAIVEPDETQPVSVAERDPLYILLVGSDSLRGTAMFTGMDMSGRVQETADVITLVRVAPREGHITLLSIPRDTLGADTEEKISTRLDNQLPEELVFAVEDLVGVPIDYYFVVSFTAFENLVDEIGGITIDVPAPITVLDPPSGKEVTVQAGTNVKLNGAQALALASAIDESDELGEARRQTMVRTIEAAMISQVASGSEDTVRRAITALRGNVSTNIDHTLLISLALDYALNASEYTIISGSAPYELSLRPDGQLVVKYNPGQWRALMSLVDTGQDPKYVVEEAKPVVVKKDTGTSSSSTLNTSSKDTGNTSSKESNKGKNSSNNSTRDSEKESSKESSKDTSNNSGKAESNKDTSEESSKAVL